MVELSEGHFHQGTHMAFCVKRNVFLIGLIDALIMKNLLKTMRFEVSLGNSTLMKLTFR